jgi:3-oxoacyl-[acyl-carrier protein] reductase
MNVLLTGASRGLGLQIAQEQLDLGNSVFAVSRTLSPELRDLIDRSNGRATFIECDLACPDSIKNQLWGSQLNNETPIHGYVSNAAIAYDDIISNLDLETLESMFRVNVFSPMVITRNVIRNMLLHRTAGSIVHISSVCSRKGFKGLAMYAATKGAMESFSKNAAREWGAKGIRSNCVVPGFMETSMSDSLTALQKDSIYRRTALGVATSLESVAATVSFLLSDASCSVTGQAFIVDGGTI